MALRAEAPAFEPIALPALPPGLEKQDCGTPALDASWASSVSTAVPSPGLSMTESPWTSPYQAFTSPELLKGYWARMSSLDFMLPDALDNNSPALSEKNYGDSDPANEALGQPMEFKLTGLEEFQSSLQTLIKGIRTRAVSVDDADSNPSEPEPMLQTPSTAAPTMPSREPTPTRSEKDLDVGPGLARPRVGSGRGWNTPSGDNSTKDPLPLPARSRQSPTSETTTATIQNIPRRCTPALLLERLEATGLRHEVDFLYVPMDLKSGCNVGQALVNFRSTEALARFTEAFHNVGVKKAFPGSSGAKPVEVVKSPYQGKEANVHRLQQSGLLLSLLAGKPAWMPQVFDEEGHRVPFPEDPHA